MIETINKFNMMGMLLVLFTMHFISQDKAFNKTIRRMFQIVAVLCFYIALLRNLLTIDNLKTNLINPSFGSVNEWAVRSIVLAILIDIFWKVKKTTQDYIFSVVLVAIALLVFITEKPNGPVNVANNILCFLVVCFYFYFVMEIYKLDGLTRLPLRNTLYFDMEDLKNKSYHLALIDADNFKLINDKYGHDKGDEVLRKIVDTTLKHLPSDCTMYRFGGDEFVIIGKKTGPEGLSAALDLANSDLARTELRISFGIVSHEPGTNGAAVITEADKRMYANKKQLKSEDIWDDMTGLYNYRGFIDELDPFRKGVVADGNHVCLISVDLDRLCNINMAYGYTEGNLAIKTLSRVIKSCLKGRDFIGHLGSDEFIVAIEYTEVDDGKIDSFVDELQSTIGSAYELASKEYTLKINTGRFFIADDDKTSSEILLNNALYAKQADKEERRKSTDVVDASPEMGAKEESLVKDILDNNRLKYAFQPIVSAKTGDIVAYESLMRSGTEMMVSPLKILKYAERNKRLYDVERYTFFNVLDYIKKSNCLPEGRRIFINSIPGCLLSDDDYAKLKDQYGDIFASMTVEITEQREIDDIDISNLNMRRARDKFFLAIDDYGSGCSNTNSLLRYMPQIVKLDRLLITGIDRNAKKQFFVNSIISFARENDMLILAEGVETENELKTVIRLGVDMIQGFFTAKPSFEILDAIDKDIKKIIVDENVKVSGNQRMVYTASTNSELSVISLAMEDYTKINISCEYLTLLGNTEYTADMVLRVKEGVSCKMIMNNVCLNSVDDEPCIEVEEGADLTIYLEGDNSLHAKGIHVSEGAKLTIKGAGNLDIFAKGHECYAIGADTESGFGNIIINNSGNININIDGENCIGIGGGVVKEGSAISLLSGSYNLNVAGVYAVGIGCFKGDKLPLLIRDNEIVSDFRVNKGVVIGAFEGELDTTIQNFRIVIEGSGTEVSGIGSINATSGKIAFDAGSYDIVLRGQKICLIGGQSGNPDISLSHTSMKVMGEGDSVLGFGTLDSNATFNGEDGMIDLAINASSPKAFGVIVENSGFYGYKTFKINGEISDIIG